MRCCIAFSLYRMGHIQCALITRSCTSRNMCKSAGQGRLHKRMSDSDPQTPWIRALQVTPSTFAHCLRHSRRSTLESSKNSFANKGRRTLARYVIFFSEVFSARTTTTHKVAWVNAVRQRHPLTIFLIQTFCHYCFCHEHSSAIAGVTAQKRGCSAKQPLQMSSLNWHFFLTTPL